MANFILAAGTNGFITTPVSLLTTELNGLTNVHTAVSSVGGTSGVFTQSSFANAPLLGIEFTSGGAFTPAAGDELWGWFLESLDGGSNFDRLASNTPLARTPDFTIPLIASAYASADRAWAQGRYVDRPPFGSFKVAVYSLTVTLPASGNIIKMGPAAMTYG